jgi:sporulation protein YlmC with PRC-barrel domain
MKNFTVGILIASLSMLAILEAVAQQRPASPPAQTMGAPDSAVESSKLIGARIKNAADKDLGEIDALLVNPNDGKVTHVVVGKGGMAGVGETKVVMPWSDLKIRADRDKVTVSVDQAALDRAPKYERRAAGERMVPPAASPRSDTPKSEEKKK